MLYKHARGRIRSGHLLAWSHRDWRTWYDKQIQMVRTFTQSEYCHVGIAYRLAGRLLVIEAVRPLVRLFPLSHLLPCYWIPVPAKWSPAAERWLLRQVGKPYSRWQAVLAGVGRLDAGKDEIWECAELVQSGERRLRVSLPGKATPSNMVAQALELAPLKLLTKKKGATGAVR